MYSLPSPSFELSPTVTASTIQILRSWIDHTVRLLACIGTYLVRTFYLFIKHQHAPLQ